MDTGRKNFIVNLLIRLTGAVLAFGMVFTSLNAAGVGVKAAEKKTETKQKVSNPKKKEVRALAKKIAKANTVNRLIKKHKSVYVIDSEYVLWCSKKVSYTRANYYSYATYVDDNGSYTVGWDPYLFRYDYIMAKGEDKHDYTYARFYIDDLFSKEELLLEKTVSIEYTDDTIIITRQFSEKSVDELEEEWDLAEITDPVYDVFEVDRNTYEIRSCYIYIKEPDNILFDKTLYLYDVEEPAECSMLRAMGERPEQKMVKYTVVRDAGTENEIRKERSIPANSVVHIYAPGTDEKYYTDPECTDPLGEWDGLSDIVVYIKTAQSTEE